MSNRKYAAAVLTDGPATIERKMDSACAILAEIMNIGVKDIIESTPLDKLGGTGSFQTYLDMKFKKMFPELHKEYEVIIGTSPTDDGMWKLVVGWRKRLPSWNEAPYTRFSPFRESRYTPSPAFTMEYMGIPYEDRVTDTITFNEPVRPMSTRTLLEEMQRSLETRLRRFTGYGVANVNMREQLRQVIDNAFRPYRGTRMQDYTWNLREELNPVAFLRTVYVEATVYFMDGDIGTINIELN